MHGFDARLSKLARYSTRAWKNLSRELTEQEKRVEAFTDFLELLLIHVLPRAPQTTNN
jgi:hypothetical protein